MKDDKMNEHEDNNDQEDECNVRVYMRCRPMNSKEKEEQEIIQVEPSRKEIIVSMKKKLEKSYHFDGVFGAEQTQEQIYNEVARPIVNEVLKGFNCTIFAYGQTGTGKTFTMEGNHDGETKFSSTNKDSGIIPRAICHIFQQLEQNKDEIEYSVRVSHLELYNEELVDLLSTDNKSKEMRIYNNNGDNRGVNVTNLEEVPVTSAEGIFSVLEKSCKQRRVAETKMNEHSSRSHCVFIITIHTKETTIDGEDLIKIGKLNLVDLAGSENVGRSGAKDQRKKEAGYINTSLLTLGRVINTLVERKGHVPYRESKLTRLLQESLGGRAKTSIIATLSPASSNFEETMSTLDYAHRAKHIKNKPQVNQKMTKKALIKDYIGEIERLKKNLTNTRQKNGIFLPPEEFEELNDKVKNQSEEILKNEDKIEALSKKIIDLEELFNDNKQKLAVTKNDLDNTTNKLESTISDLMDTKLRLEEHKYILSEHQNNEEVLHSNAINILQALENTKIELEEMHKKVERTLLHENKNVNVKTKVEKEISNHVETSNSNFTSFVKRINEQVVPEHIEFLQNSETERIEKNESLSKQVNSFDSALQTNINNFQLQMKNQNENTCQEVQKHTQKMISHLSTSKKKSSLFLQNCNIFSEESSQHNSNVQLKSGEMNNEIKELLSENYKTSQTMFDLFQDSLKEKTLEISQHKEEFQQKIEHQDNHVEQFISQQKQNAEIFQKFLLEGVQKMMSDFVSQQENQLSSFRSSYLETSQENKTHLSKFHEISRQNIVDSKDFSTKLFQNFTDIYNATKEKLEEMSSFSQKQHQKFTSLSNSFVETFSSYHSSSIKKVEEIEKDLNQFNSTYQKMSSENLERNQQSLIQSQTCNFEHLEMLKNEVSQISELSSSHNFRSLSSLKEVTTHLSNFEGEFSNKQTKFTEILSFVQNIDTLVPTGETPVKRTIKHPTDLPRTKDSKEIIEEYNKQRKTPSTISSSTTTEKISIPSPTIEEVIPEKQVETKIEKTTERSSERSERSTERSSERSDNKVLQSKTEVSRNNSFNNNLSRETVKRKNSSQTLGTKKTHSVHNTRRAEKENVSN